MPDGSSEPDKIFTNTLSRREALALGASGMAGLAGCSGLTERVSDLQSKSDSTQTTTPSPDESVSISADFTIDEATVELDIGTYAESDTPFSGVLTLYSSPHLNEEERTEIGSKSIEQTQQSSSYTITLEYELDYPQRFSISLKISEPIQQSETEIYRTEKVHLPFYNAARDTEMVRVVGPPYSSGDAWAARGEGDSTAQFWFDTPDESPFDVPSIDESNYDPNWYKYQDLTITALLRFPTFDKLFKPEGMDKVPYYQWAVINISLSEWELLEAFRWNSISNHLVEGEHWPYSENPTEAQKQYYEDTGKTQRFVGGSTSVGSTMPSDPDDYFKDGSSAPIPFSEYSKARYNGITTVSEVNAGTLKFASGRTFCKRLAEEFKSKLDNPSFNRLSHREYHKALALKAFVGKWPYELTISGAYYSKAPEETVYDWWRNANGELDTVGICQDAAYLYNGVALHLLDVGVANLEMHITGIYHMSAGLINPSLPQETIKKIGSHPAPMGHDPRVYDTEQGTIAFVECTYPNSTIGWGAGTDSGDVDVFSYLMNASINSHIPVNDNYEPSQDGTVRAPASNPEIPWEYAQNHTTIGNIENFKLERY